MYSRLLKHFHSFYDSAAAAPIAGIVQAQAYGGGVQLMANPAVAAAGGTVVASPQQLPQRAGEVTAGMIAGLTGAAGKLIT